MYIGVMISGGIFGAVWLVLILRDINALERKNVFYPSSVAIVLSSIMAAGFAFLCFKLLFGPVEWRVTAIVF